MRMRRLFEGFPHEKKATEEVVHAYTIPHKYTRVNSTQGYISHAT